MRISSKAAAAAACATTAVLVLSACGSGSGGGGGNGGGGAGEATDENKPAQLTVAAWMDFPPDLLAEFEAEHGIEVVVNSFPNGEAAQTVLRNGLAAGGAGLSDVHLIGMDWIPEMFAVPEDFAVLPPVPDRWLDWVTPISSVDGDLLGYPTDIGPQALTFDSTLLAEAGLASDPEGFVQLVGGQDATWEDWIDAGHAFVEASDVAWVDSMFFPLLAAISQMDAAFENPDTGNAIPLAENTAVRDRFMLFADAAAEGVSAGIAIGHTDWGAGFQARAWATVVTPAWMAAIIEENAAGVDGWRIADVIPGGTSTWGGSFFTVPSAGQNVAWATELADHLTSGDAAVQWFETTGQFPSQVDAMDAPEIADVENAFWGGQRPGAIYGALAQSVPAGTEPGFIGVHYPGILALVMDAVRRVEDGTQTPAESWDSAVAAFDALGLPTD